MSHQDKVHPTDSTAGALIASGRLYVEVFRHACGFERGPTMSGKRRHRERQARREALAERDRLEALARGVVVDPDALAPSNRCGQPDFVIRGCYVDVPFTCRECGVEQVWTAERQKWWYEVAKGDVFSTAILCRPCRQHARARRGEAQPRDPDPNP